MSKQTKTSPEFESRLLPILREAVDIVKMLFFSRIKQTLGKRYSDTDARILGKVAGAVINELFGVCNPDPEFAAFRVEQKELIEETMQTVPEFIEELHIPLSDALRVSVLCDFQEDGLDNATALAKAKDLGILLHKREMPMPNSFLDMVRRVGKAHGLVIPPQPENL